MAGLIVNKKNYKCKINNYKCKLESYKRKLESYKSKLKKYKRQLLFEGFVLDVLKLNLIFLKIVRDGQLKITNNFKLAL